MPVPGAMSCADAMSSSERFQFSCFANNPFFSKTILNYHHGSRINAFTDWSQSTLGRVNITLIDLYAGSDFCVESLPTFVEVRLVLHALVVLLRAVLVRNISTEKKRKDFYPHRTRRPARGSKSHLTVGIKCTIRAWGHHRIREDWRKYTCTPRGVLYTP